MERRQQVEEIFHEALRRDPSQRDAYVRDACGNDSSLQKEIADLLARHADAPEGIPLQQGQSLGPYRIESFVAAGGMGQVYRATDTRLNRGVAIKVCAGRFSERFAHEATVIASLNHPHICHLYDVGPQYLVMEFVEGAPLRGPLPLQQAMEYAGQILDALDAAHRKGVTHRDLKPANILVTRQGIKLLDFGLAKQSGPLQETDVTRALTQQGEIVGTLQYMSPEQLQGKEADARSDLFSFGCVLYEMLTGKRAFEGQSAASVIAAILEREPASWGASPPLDRVLRRCLAKDPDQRFQSALDLKTALQWAAEQPAAEKAGRRATIAAAAAMLVLGTLGGWMAASFRTAPADESVQRFQIAPPEGGGFSGGGNLGGGFAISPDGRILAFIGVVKGKTGLWFRPLDSANARLIPGSEGAMYPFWSPDGGSIAFAAGNVLQRFDLPRQTTSKICDLPGPLVGGSWSSGGQILFALRANGLYQVPVTGGTPSQVTSVDRAHGEFAHVKPQILPGGRFLYEVWNADSQNGGVYAASFAKPAAKVRLVENASDAWYTSGAHGEDHLLWIRDRTLLVQRFDSEKLQLNGEPHMLAEPATIARAGGRVLLFGASIGQRQFKWLDRTGNEAGLLGQTGPWVFARISPDGRNVVTIRGGLPSEVWLLETGRGVATRLTSGSRFHISPIWSPDGRSILCSAGSPFNIFRVPADGSGIEEQITQSPNRQTVFDWSRDGRYVIYGEPGADTLHDLWLVPVSREGRLAPGTKPAPFVVERFDQRFARFSPDTRWVAYQSNESGQFEIYVRRFPEPREKKPISTGGGIYPQWGSDGRELFYASLDGKLMAVALKPSGDSLDVSLPHELFASQALLWEYPYEATTDGQRFLISETAASPEPLTVILNWPALLKKGSGAP
jgi:Tol biopolymer transport system component/predicted Ser/Thr protein kinase